MRTVLCGYYGKGNGGDEALLACLLQMLPETVRPLVLSGDPGQTQKVHQVEACDRFSAPVVWSALRGADAFIFGGGSLMQDATSPLSPLYYGGLMGLAQQLGLVTLAWAQGIGPLNRRLTRRLTRRVFQGCRGVSVRDEGSAQWLQKWQVPCLVAPDPVWALEPLPVKGLSDLPAPRIAVSLRPHPLLTPDRLECLIQALVNLQQATEACMLLLPFQPVVDRPLAQQVLDRLPRPAKILELTQPRHLKGVFQGVEMVISMRFHGLIMAAAEGCRCFALSYDPKVSYLMQELALPGWELDQLPDTAQVMSRTWLDCYANGEPLEQSLIVSLRDRALMHRDLLRDALMKF